MTRVEVFRTPTFASISLVFIALLFPGRAGAQEFGLCDRLKAWSLGEAAKQGRVADLTARADEAAAFVQSDPDAFRRCPDLAGALRALAAGLTEAGEFARAMAACDLLGRGAPLRGEDLLLCARPALRTGRVVEARQLLAAYVAEAGGDPASRAKSVIQAVEVLEETARYREAAEFLGLGLGFEVSGPLALRQLQNLLRAGDGDAAREAFESASRRPDMVRDAGFLRDACLLFVRYGKTDLARRAAGLLVTVPRFGEAEADTVVLAAEAASDLVLAERTVRRLIGEAGSPERRGGVLRTAAAIMERHGFVGSAVRILSDGLRDQILSEVEDQVWLARLLIREGQALPAHQVLDRLVEARKTGPEWDRLADLWLDAGRPEEATAFLKRHEKPADTAWLLALGRALHRARRDDEETSLYEEAASRLTGSDRFDFWRMVGTVYLDRPDLVRALEAFRRALGAATTGAQKAHAHLDIAETLLKRADGPAPVSRDIESEVLSAMDLGGDDWSVGTRIDQVTERVGRLPALSLVLLEAAVRRDPSRAGFWRRLGVARLGARRFGEAVEALVRFVQTSAEPRTAVEEVLTILLDADRPAEVVFFVVYSESKLSSGTQGATLAISPGLARRVGMACASLGDRPCVSRYLGRFLDAPVQQESDYLECARTLAGLGLWTLAERAVEKAFRALPPDLAWEADFAAGEVALARGHAGDAQAHFQKALSSAPQKRGMVGRIASAHEEAGRWRLAASWWKRAVQEMEGSARLQALGRLIEALMRLEDRDAIREAVRQAFPEPPEGPAAWTLMEFLDAAGLTEDAADIAMALSGLATRALDPSSGLPRIEGLDPRTAWPWLVRLFTRAGRTREAIEKARGVCLRTDDDSVCLEVSRVLSDRSFPHEAIAVLDSRCGRRECGAPLLVEVAGLKMRVGDRAGAVAAARRAAQRCDAPEVVLDPLGPLFRNARAWKDYLEVLEVLRKRREFLGDADLALQTAQALIETHDDDGAMLLLSAHLGTGRGREAAVYRLLAAEGLRDEAIRVLVEAPTESLEALHVSELRDIIADLDQTGRRDIAGRLLDRLERSDNGRLATETVARILQDLGRHEDALAAFERSGADRVSPEGRLDWVRLLWKTGNRPRALEVARGVVLAESRDRAVYPANPPGRRSGTLDKDEFLSACHPLVAFFLDEDAVAEAWTLYQACSPPVDPGELESRLAVAMVRSGDERFLVLARNLFVSTLIHSGLVNADPAEFIRIEVARGRAGDLIRQLEAWGTSRPLLEARVVTACLAGLDREVGRAIADLSGSPEEPDVNGRLAAARALLRCGRFWDAHRNAMDGLRVSGPGGPLGSLSRIAVRSGLAAGLADTPRVVENLVRTRVEDRARFFGLVARVRMDAGDRAGNADALFRRSLCIEDARREKAGYAAFRAALEAGDPDLASRVADLVIGGSRHRVMAVLSLADVARRRLRDEVALTWLTEELARWPGDPELARALLDARLRTGSDDDVSDAALAYARTLEDDRSGWADVVVLAAQALRMDLVDEGLRHLESGVLENRVADAHLSAGIAFLRMGDEVRGREAIVLGASRARDVRVYLTRVAEATIENPSVPETLIEEVSQAAGPLTPEEAGSLPLVQAARCLAGEAPSVCIRTPVSRDPVAILLAGFRKALLTQRYREALALLGVIQEADASRATALQTAAILVATVWPVTKDRRESARELGLAAREALARTGTRTVPEYPGLEAHMADLCSGPGAGLATYASRLSVAPADAEVRNNVAYYLSVGGLDLRRALREARLAVALSSRGHAFYLETEAWAWFLAGETRRALALQERARNLWRLDQGGGLAESFLHLGRMYEAAGRARDAREAYRKAAVLEPLEAAGVEALWRWRDLARSTGSGIH